MGGIDARPRWTGPDEVAGEVLGDDCETGDANWGKEPCCGVDVDG